MVEVSRAPSSQDEGWHAEFSPSSSERWMTCPGSIAASRGVEQPSNEYADEGTVAHTVASRALQYDKPAAFFIGEQIQIGDTIWTVTEEMADYVQVYLDEVRGRVGDGTLLYEQRVWFSETIGVPEQGGTSDCIVLRSDCKHLTVGDLKYGIGIRVDAEENTQMMTYALGVLETFAAIMEDVQEVTMFISQPRLDHLSEWTCSIERLQQHAAEIKDAAARALDACSYVDLGTTIPEMFFKVSEDACRWCPVEATCEHLRRQVSALVFNDFEVLDTPETALVVGASVPTGPTLGQLYGSIDLIEDYCRTIRAEVERMVLNGMEVIGPDGERMKLVEGKKGRRSWADQEAAKAALAGQLPPDKYLKPQPIITPAEAEKLLGKGKGGKVRFAEAFGGLIKQAPGKAHVALGSDPRPPYTPEAGADEFEELGDE